VIADNPATPRAKTAQGHTMTRTNSRFLGMAATLALMLSSGSVVFAESSQMAPSFTVENFNGGETLALHRYRGKVVYVDFWASWCRPCLKSFPFMERLYQQYAVDGLVIIAINMDEDAADAVKFLDEHAVAFLIGQDRDGKVAKRFGVKALPTSFVIDREGRIQERHYGFKPSHEDKITEAITSLL
jgi:thiol-disulfide isomerase/thioredoxin